VIRQRSLLNPLRHGFYSLQLFTHKVLRRLMALPLIIILLLSPWLWTAGVFFQALVVVQLAGYCCAALGWLLRDSSLGKLRLFTLPLFFCMTNAAALVAIGHLLCGRRIVVWEPRREMSAAVGAANPP
jgi:hypothetical protein